MVEFTSAAILGQPDALQMQREGHPLGTKTGTESHPCRRVALWEPPSSQGVRPGTCVTHVRPVKPESVEVIVPAPWSALCHLWVGTPAVPTCGPASAAQVAMKELAVGKGQGMGLAVTGFGAASGGWWCRRYVEGDGQRAGSGLDECGASSVERFRVWRWYLGLQVGIRESLPSGVSVQSWGQG